MFKLLVLSCLLFSCLADPFGLPSWLREGGRHRQRGCADRAEGWRACARRNGSEALAPHSGDCSLFYYCSGLSRPVCRQCPAGLHFNPQLQVCDWPAEVNCTPRPPRPPRPPRGNGTTTDAPAANYTSTTPDNSTFRTSSSEILSSSSEPAPSTSELPSNATDYPSNGTDYPSNGTYNYYNSTDSPANSSSGWYDFWSWGR
ncbi:hypothetical protein PYW07_016306 [Mythimna separata]|uniref:Chitin-binding type-2 domain-containing protein n=1 Tax=Mythimna separata TaxID=271217 RepID=A0AAD7YJF6_MYTSE|nr:hypothetical protein PYW07_016306 [Mythimna separata]